MATISNNNLSWNNLPEVPLLNVISHLDKLKDLAALSQVNNHFHSMILENSVWKQIAEKIGLSLAKITDTYTVRNQVENHILAVRQDIRCFPDTLPTDIAKIVNSPKIPSFTDIQLLKAYRKARDILIVWANLAKTINQPIPKWNFNTSTEAIESVKDEVFESWCAQNQNTLAQISFCDLIRRNFSILPPQIKYLPQVTELYLFSNNLSELPSEITQLTRLKILDLSFNRLFTLPSGISQLSQLKHLKLDGNYFSELPLEIGGLLNLTVLELAKNRFSKFPLEVIKLANLKILRLQQNNLNFLPSEIAKLTKLEYLDLMNNHLCELPQEISQMSLKLLIAFGNPFSKETYAKHWKLIYKRQIYLIRNAIAGIGLVSVGAFAYLNPNGLISGLTNGLPYAAAIGAAVAIQKLVHRYF